MIRYVTGDATQPQDSGPKLLVHICNDIGAWGRGFVVALSKRWTAPELAFNRWASGQTDQPYALGEVQFVPVQADLTVANLIGQHDIARKNRPTDVPPVRYEAIRAGLAQVRTEAQRTGASVHMPRIGAGVAGGDWRQIEPIITEELAAHGVPVTVYDLPSPEST
ncbi:macro domain-containing protein [Deinococcus radiotolerans]|uniref:Appr-1-p processing protein n=1 Tax=Deinococcus radiotolerans TaxID=1309407 RepID=A0ABQ2FHV0_9DEIO|nr:macro domain-containing protein [Deinococcus radiotolerans]GGK99998.1 Appr-1-p processing protein [Deinococcus radiotolerans]